jgi:hypothetical protein
MALRALLTPARLRRVGTAFILFGLVAGCQSTEKISPTTTLPVRPQMGASTTPSGATGTTTPTAGTSPSTNPNTTSGTNSPSTSSSATRPAAGAQNSVATDPNFLNPPSLNLTSDQPNPNARGGGLSAPRPGLNSPILPLSQPSATGAVATPATPSLSATPTAGPLPPTMPGATADAKVAPPSAGGTGLPAAPPVFDLPPAQTFPAAKQ